MALPAPHLSRPADLLRLLCIGLWASFSLPAFGAASNEPARTPALTPEAPIDLPPLDVRAGALPADDVTLRPYAVGRSVWSDRTIVTLKDALGLAPGVLLQESFGGFEPPRLSIRGSGLQSAPSSRGVQFLLEGFPLTLSDGSFNAALIDPQLLDWVEVHRGEASARAAPAVMGGAFNLRTAPSSADAAASGRVELGSFGGARVVLSGRTFSSAGRLQGAVSLSRQDGYREHSAQERLGFFAQTHAQPVAGFDRIFSLYHVHADYEVPGPLTLAAATRDPRSISDDVRRDQPRRHAAVTQLVARTRRSTPAGQLEGGLAWLHTDDWFRQLRGNGITDSRSDDMTLRGALTRRFDPAPGDLLLRLGASLSQGWREWRRFENDRAATGRPFGHDDLSATTAALDVEGKLHLTPNLSATAGLAGVFERRAAAERIPSDAAVTSGKASHHGFELQPRVQARWTPTPRTTWFAAVARTTEPPTFDDLLVVTGAPGALTQRRQSLQHQRATTWELGTAGSIGCLGWDLTVYHGDWANEILRLADAQGLPRGAVNAGPTRHAGVETALHWQVLSGDHRLRLTSTATWSRFAFKDDPVFGRNRLAGAPPRLGTAQLRYDHPRGGFLAALVDWTSGASPVDHAGRMTYSGRTLTHLRAGWRRNQRWSAFLEVRNAFNRQHIASTAGVLDLVRQPAATAVFLPGPGRALTVGIEWQR